MSNEYEYSEKQRKRKENIKLAIFSIIFFGILLGFFVPMIVYKSSGPVEFYTDVIGRMNSPTLSGTVYLKNVPIHLEGNLDFTQYDLDKLTAEVPDVLLQNCNEIYMCQKGTNSTCDREYAKYDWSNSPTANVGGFANLQTNNLYLFNRKQSNTFIHELMHLFDERNGQLRNQEYVVNLYNQHAAKISNYAMSNVQEFLAVSAEQYFLEPEKLQRNAQPVYDYFQSLFHYYA